MSTSLTMGSDGSSRLREREIKIGLVLYGGVSLAIYEYGVVRCFHDLVRGHGIFGPLLEALGSTAQVDVIAGTSAGGINGILLAAALESGQSIAQVAGLWRKKGDIENLFREVGSADEDVPSLLKGETYYHDQLEQAFHELCKPADDVHSPGEIDLFVTGTDVSGYGELHHDALGAPIEDKRHRVVFHLKHRPGRRALGLAHGVTPETRTPHHLRVQAALLASIARITSCFPGAFPPFRTSDLERDGQAGRKRDPDLRREVEKALYWSSGRRFDAAGEFIDGGVLDNKPFGPVLEAIFYRMPTGVVDRKLFYVEPDPVPAPEPPAPPGEGRSRAAASRSTPLSVAFDALSRIPSHESISGDLEQLERHNERLDWLRGLSDRIRSHPGGAAAAADDGVYAATRVEALARALLMTHDGVPVAERLPERPELRALLEPARTALAGLRLSSIDPFDVDFHLRRAFYVLYRLYRDVERDHDPRHPDYSEVPDVSEIGRANTVAAIGRLVKALKLVRSLLLDLRTELWKPTEGDEAFPDVGRLLSQARGFLDAEREHWAPLLAALRSPVRLDVRFDVPSLFVSDSQLDAVRRQAIDRLAANPSQPGAERTVLGEISQRLRDLESACNGESARFDGFGEYDAAFYPLMFLSGIHELDRIEIVRVSPHDAQLGLSELSPHLKISGDTLGHFAAFLRRDWRSNDILWGRLDGIARIVVALLDPAARARLRARPEAVAGVFSEEKLGDALRHCDPELRASLRRRWEAVVAAWQHGYAGDPADQFPHGTGPEAAFVKELVRAAQEDAAAEELPKVLTDLRWQELKWGRLERAQPSDARGQAGGDAPPDPPRKREDRPRPRVGTDANPELLEREARREAQADLERLASSPGEVFRSMRLGDQTVGDEVPMNVIGEYLSRSYLLLWGMFQFSLRNGLGGQLRKRRVRMLLRDPVRFAHWMFWGMRNEPASATVFAGVVPALLLGAFALAIVLGSGTYAVVAFAILVAYMVGVVPHAVPEKEQHRVWPAVMRGMFAAALAILGALLLVHVGELLGSWARGYFEGLLP